MASNDKAPPAKNEQPLAYRVVDALLRRGLRLLPIWKWTESLALWWGYRFRPLPTVARLRSGALIQVDPTDYLQLMIYYFGAFEPHCVKYLKRCVETGGTIVDVGANIGLYTVESSLVVGASGRVIAIEAAPSHVRTLSKNIELNEMSNVSLIAAAVGDATSQAKLTLPSGVNLGMFTLAQLTGMKCTT